MRTRLEKGQAIILGNDYQAVTRTAVHCRMATPATTIDKAITAPQVPVAKKHPGFEHPWQKQKRQYRAILAFLD
ncbi:MAG TPA: hypothetical protein VLC79_16380 [Cellvibrio sp.]|nr:hypothetical protein [Cellvibrio sp.]